MRCGGTGHPSWWPSGPGSAGAVLTDQLRAGLRSGDLASRWTLEGDRLSLLEEQHWLGGEEFDAVVDRLVAVAAKLPAP